MNWACSDAYNEDPARAKPRDYGPFEQIIGVPAESRTVIYKQSGSWNNEQVIIFQDPEGPHPVKEFPPCAGSEFSEKCRRALFIPRFPLVGRCVHVKRRDSVSCSQILWASANTFDFRIREALLSMMDHGLEGTIIAQVLLTEQAKQNDLLRFHSVFPAVLFLALADLMSPPGKPGIPVA